MSPLTILHYLTPNDTDWFIVNVRDVQSSFKPNTRTLSFECVFAPIASIFRYDGKCFADYS